MKWTKFWNKHWDKHWKRFELGNKYGQLHSLEFRRTRFGLGFDIATYKGGYTPKMPITRKTTPNEEGNYDWDWDGPVADVHSRSTEFTLQILWFRITLHIARPWLDNIQEPKCT